MERKGVNPKDIKCVSWVSSERYGEVEIASSTDVRVPTSNTN